MLRHTAWKYNTAEWSHLGICEFCPFMIRRPWSNNYLPPISMFLNTQTMSYQRQSKTVKTKRRCSLNLYYWECAPVTLSSLASPSMSVEVSALGLFSAQVWKRLAGGSKPIRVLWFNALIPDCESVLVPESELSWEDCCWWTEMEK